MPVKTLPTHFCGREPMKNGAFQFYWFFKALKTTNDFNIPVLSTLVSLYQVTRY